MYTFNITFSANLLTLILILILILIVKIIYNLNTVFQGVDSKANLSRFTL